MNASFSSDEHVADLLPDYLSQSLDEAVMPQVAAHLKQCVVCRHEFEAWQRLGTVMHESVTTLPQPRADLLDCAWETIAATPRRSTLWQKRLFPIWQVACAQIRLLNPLLWLASGLGIAFATWVTSGQPGSGEWVLGLILPLIAAVGMAFLFSQEIDIRLEMALATPTPPRLVLVSRWFWLFAYDLVLSIVATLVLAALGHEGFWPLVSLWLGPMALLSSFSLLFSSFAGPIVALVLSVAAGIGRFFSLSSGFDPQRVHDGFWQTSPLIFFLAALCLALAVIQVQHQERLSSF
jgi:hypothetical protein